MGLDNIPKNYPCRTQGTVVTVKVIDRTTGDLYRDENGETVDQIDCDQTKACGGCPWQKALGDRPGAVYGLFASSCWYRGKWGYHILDALGIDAEDLYGDDDQNISPNTARELADAIHDRFTDDAWTRQTEIDVDGDNVADDVWYLHDWLLWVALECDGAIAWS